MDRDKKITIGIFAHVDAGKTTLSEAMLYLGGSIRELGRVDHKDAFLDSNSLEKERGITIFAGQAEFDILSKEQERTSVTLLDTPGHVDFSWETQRTLKVIDYGILLISGREGIQGHTLTLWRLLEQQGIPVFVFANKMDMEGSDPAGIMSSLREALGSGFVNMTAFDLDGTVNQQVFEELALCDEKLLEEYMAEEKIALESLKKSIAERKVFPCYFGSALKLEGVKEFMEALGSLTLERAYPDKDEELQARVFRITRTSQGERLTHMKILGGSLNVRDRLPGDEKVNQIRVYSGEKYKTLDYAEGGTLCAVTGPVNTFAGQEIGMGKEDEDEAGSGAEARGKALMTYSLILPEGANIQDVYTKLKLLEEEEPELHVTWKEQTGDIQLGIMGEVHLEILKEIIGDRLEMDVAFDRGRISYRETIRKPVRGAGHFEPLRHYAEVHLLLEPLPQGSGIVCRTDCSEDVLDRNWQRLIMTHLKEREHIGTLTGSPIDDMRITIVTGRAHAKHTEGGDFRQATYRALRQALRKSLAQGEMVLLEPWYSFRLQVPQENLGKAISDIQRMGGTFEPPKSLTKDGKTRSYIKGKLPVSESGDYALEVASYTKGYGRFDCSFAGYLPCHNQDEIVESTGYDADRDAENTGDSVFCIHGAGHTVSWEESDEMMHMESGEKKEEKAEAQRGFSRTSLGDDGDLQEIFDRTFRRGSDSKSKRKSIEAREFESEQERRRKEAERRRRAKEALKLQEEAGRPECLIVDGYNIIFAWEELKALAKVNIDGARDALIEILGNYKGYRSCEVIVVFDAYKVKGGQGHREVQSGVTVVYTGEAETADTYIERATFAFAKGDEKGNYRVRVATSDRLEQMIIMGNNAQRVSATDFKEEVERANREISGFLKELNRRNQIENPNRIQIPQKKEK